jgi:signal transduction histidine kinase
VAVCRQRCYAEALAEQVGQRAATAERLRIARDLHDVIGHGITLITAKAAVTNYLAGTDPEQARAALWVIEETGHATLAEMRRMLEVLRADAVIPMTAQRPGSPLLVGGEITSPAAPGLAGLDALAAQATEAGVRTSLEVRGEPSLPETVSLTAYRIVQEALTNVIRHARATTCTLMVDITAGYVTIEISDDGRALAAAQAPGGHGIAGMRERAALIGGELRVGPHADGGWLVTARLPAGRPARHGAGTEQPA